jgi:hypothetical protein
VADFDRMRADFLTVTEERKARQGWNAEDVAELGVAVKAAMDAGAEEDLQAWSDYLAAEASVVRRMAQACRDAEVRIRTDRQAERKRLEGAAA